MEDYRTVLKLIQEGSYMCTINLKQAYYSIPIHKEFRKYLSFKFDDQIYHYCALPFGLSLAPYIFTKVTKPILSYLRSKNVTCVLYLDDFVIINTDYSKAQCDTNLVLNILELLGFIVNIEKSKINPMRQCIYLGFMFDSNKMIFSLPMEKKQKIFLLCEELLFRKSTTIRHLAQFIGVLTSACPAVKYSWQYTKLLERCKVLALITNQYNFNSKISIPDYVLTDLIWWRDHILNSFNNIKKDEFHMEIYTDASLTGWGAVYLHHNVNKSTHSWWSNTEQELHKNILELKAVFMALQSFTSNVHSKNILLRIDNSTAIAYINKM